MSLLNFRGSGNSFTRQGYQVKEGGSRKGKNNSIARFAVSQLCGARDCHFGLASIQALTDLHGKQNGVA